MQATSSRPRTAGFNLVEAAIVLGIVGLVIGGIWAAYSQVTLNRQTSKLQQDILQINNGLWNLFKNIPMPAGTSLGAAAASGGILPGDWKWNGIDSPLGAVFTSENGIEWQMYPEFVNRPKLWAYVGSAHGQMPAALCERLSRIFYPEVAGYLAASATQRTVMMEAVMQRTNGIRLQAIPDCSDDALFQLDFYRRAY